MKRILSTKKLSTYCIDTIVANGWLYEEIELIQIRSLSPSLLSPLLQQTSVMGIFTSAHAVESVQQACDKLAIPYPFTHVYCLSGRTYTSVKKSFPMTRVVSIATDACSLAIKIVAQHSLLQSYVFYCGNQRRDELPQVLSQNKISFQEVCVYETIAITQLIERNFDYILFFSPSGVESYFTCNQLSIHTIPICIGKTTAQVVKKYVHTTVLISSIPTPEAMIELVHSIEGGY